MPKRQRFELPEEEKDVEAEGGLYDLEQVPVPGFVRSGSTLLDDVIGGGWALSRVSHVYGGSATGKTLLGMEGYANFGRQYSNGLMFYREKESAYEETYARKIGVPVDDMDIEQGLVTIEDLFDDLTDCIKRCDKAGEPGFYVVDSVDAFPAQAEEDSKDIRDQSSVAVRARRLSELFRRRINGIARAKMHVMFVSQTRTRIGVTHGRKTEASVGTALRFYASQILFLRQVKVISKTVRKVDRPIGILVSAKNEKSRMGMPYREVEFPVLFEYGIDDLTSCAEFLHHVDELKQLLPKPTTPPAPKTRGAKAAAPKAITVEDYIRSIEDIQDDKEYRSACNRLKNLAHDVWMDIEELTRERHLPSRPKYR